ncbi:amino acid adenylation domain-containing protein [Streptosporangium lutulentum]|uniref:Amino acid adenylation domain-containing protein n=1 Tax=Streptosporangium lutulentum TaxID=1461250 RepID=A0ABT9QG00_9ACTN|nr:amino acid adenylation domain-containing protein [Streptosporangium lutulentum]MDP9845617.1 amino acid adenylation domain-containing protein [Streptosporangium lutulentum]
MNDLLSPSAGNPPSRPGTDSSHLVETTAADLIVARARAVPDAVAVAQWDEKITYRELVGRAAALSARLGALGVGPESRVGICVERRPEMVVAVLGVLLAGGCYVPLDPAGPRLRLRDMTADAGLDVVVCDQAGAEAVGEAGPRCVAVPGPAEEPVDLTAVPACPAAPDNLAYVLYTSGSSGRPKGVLVTHRNLVSFVVAYVTNVGADHTTRALGFSSLGFDASSIDLFVPLSVGGSVQLADDTDRTDPARLRRFIAEHRVTWGFVTPAVLSLLDPVTLPGWRVVMCGGAAVPPELVDRWAAPGRRFVNIYGPTETTVVVVTDELTAPQVTPVPIGFPTPGHRCHVVDDRLRPVEPGVEGELLVGGPGVTRGYLNSPGLTAGVFVPDPFSGEPGARLYRTGDMVRYADDGRLVYLGRRDGQIKVRGQRIELGEVAAVLQEHPAVAQAAVEALPRTGGDLELVAFLTPRDAPADIGYAASRLTAAMLPGRVLRLPELPLTSSGKVDRARLRELADEERPADVSPEGGTAAERALAAIWRRFGVGADFFASGGDSITAMRLVAAVRDELGLDVTVDDVFAGRTLPEIARRFGKAPRLPGPELVLGHPPTLAPPQRRLWFLDQLAPEAAPYNIALAERLLGSLEVPALRAALRAVAERHAVLRWRIRQNAGVPYAVCEPPSEVDLTVVDLSGYGLAQRDVQLRTRLSAGAAAPFDLAGGPPWRAWLYVLGPDEHVLALTLHHAVFDGWSQDTLYTDLSAAYAAAVTGPAADLAPLRASYADYAVWRAERDRRTGEADLAWWTEHLGGAPTVLELPRDRPRPAVQTYRGAEARVLLPPGVDAAVRALAADLGATPAGVLLAGLGRLLHRLTGTADHVIGAVIADRRVAAFDDLVGFFIDMVPLRLRSDDDADFATLVRRCARELLDIAAHPAAPLERVVERLGIRRDPSRAPLVQVMFNVLNLKEPRLGFPGLSSETIEVDKPGSPFDMTVYVAERNGGFSVEVVYNPDLFDAVRIEAMLADYVNVLGALAADPATPVGAVALPGRVTPDSAPGAMRVAEPHTPPPNPGNGSSATEQLIAAIWREVLERDTVGPDDNFFDIGGHSLALAAVHARLCVRLDRELRMVDLFRYPSIRALAVHLDTQADGPVEDGSSEIARATSRAEARRNRIRRPRRVNSTTGQENDHDQ